MATVTQPAQQRSARPIPAEMQAAVYRGKGEVRLETVSVPEIGSGELLLRVLIESALGKDSSYVALANAWGGDSTVILTSGKSMTVLWLVAFTNDESAETFADAYGSALDTINGAHTTHRIERNGREVLVMVGDGALRFKEFVPEVWQNSTVTDASIVR